MIGRRRVSVLSGVLMLGTAGAFAAAAPGQRTGGPISSVAVTDRVGDAVGAGGDLQSVTYSVSTDGVLSLAATYSNRSDLGAAPSTQFDIDSQDGSASANVAAFSGYPSQLSIWSNGGWVEQHQLSAGTWSGHTFTLTVTLSDLQNTLHVPVTPTLRIAALSVEQNGDQVSIDDAAPDSGFAVVATQASAPPAPAATTTAPRPTPTPTATTPTRGVKTPPPYWDEAIRRLPHDRIEWTKLVVERIPAGYRASIRCTAVCKRSEQLTVTRGRAVSRRFVNVPFAHGSTFVLRIVGPAGTGWWTRTTVVERGMSGQETDTRDGCIAAGGRLEPLVC
jgi:hypothetical protein